jgi:hypothetical protein
MINDTEKISFLNNIFKFYYSDCFRYLKYYVTKDSEPSLYSKSTFLEFESYVLNLDSNLVSKFAIYLSKNLGFANEAILLIVLLIKKGDFKNSDLLIDRVIENPNQIKQLLTTYKTLNNYKNLKKLSNNLKKGINNSLNKFEKGYFIKNSDEISFKDIILLTHPTPLNNKKQVFFKYILDDNLEKEPTWRSHHDKLLKKGVAKSFILKEISKFHIPYNELLRNIKKFLSLVDSEESLKLLLNKILDIGEIKDSKSFIFTFVHIYYCLRYKKLPYINNVLLAIEEALDQSFNSIDLFKNKKVLLAVDTSNYYLEYQINFLITLMLLVNKNLKNSVTGFLVQDFEIFNSFKEKIFLDRISIKNLISKKNSAGNLNKIIEFAINEELVFDKFVIFTGFKKEISLMKIWNKYRSSINSKAELIIFNPFGDLKDFNRVDLHLFDGWSDKLFYSLEDILKLKKNINAIEEFN